MWQKKYASAVPKNLGLGLDFRLCSEGDFLTGCPWSVVMGISDNSIQFKYYFLNRYQLSHRFISSELCCTKKRLSLVRYLRLMIFVTVLNTIKDMFC